MCCHKYVNTTPVINKIYLMERLCLKKELGLQEYNMNPTCVHLYILHIVHLKQNCSSILRLIMANNPMVV